MEACNTLLRVQITQKSSMINLENRKISRALPLPPTPNFQAELYSFGSFSALPASLSYKQGGVGTKIRDIYAL